MPLKTYHHIRAHYEELFAGDSPFSQLTEEDMDFMFKKSNSVSFSKRDIVFKQHTRAAQVVFVLKGLVKIFKEGRNQRIINLKIVSPGHFIGLASVLGSDWHEYSASPIEDAEVLFTDQETIQALCVRNGDFAVDLLKILSKDSLFLIDKLMAYSHKQLPGRIADVLLYFSEEIYQSQEFTVPLTRQELAELAGTTKESFIRTLNEFKHDKIIELDSRRIKIISLKLVRILSDLG